MQDRIPEFQCSACGRELFALGLCYVCRNVPLYEDQVAEMIELNAREAYSDEVD